MPKKGKKSMKGVGDLYESPKKRYNIMLTEKTKKRMDAIAEGKGLSTSELIERTFQIVEDPKKEPAQTA